MKHSEKWIRKSFRTKTILFNLTAIPTIITAAFFIFDIPDVFVAIALFTIITNSLFNKLLTCPKCREKIILGRGQSAKECPHCSWPTNKPYPE